jgi:hypothetical protein
MLVGAEPRGLPVTRIDRIEFQRASEGRPLDDVIVHAHDELSDPAVLEVQVKRSITFTPSDPLFRSVVLQIVEASRIPEFWSSRYELAIAVARTSRKIEGAYQDVLTWARRLGSAETFVARIDRHGASNPDMRRFVDTFKSNLRNAGADDDSETVWQLLRKLQILVFDFTAQGSASEELANERAARALHSDETSRAANLWGSLIELALETAASGGDLTRNQLIEDLRLQSYRLAGDLRYSSARAALAEASRNALADIGDQVGAVTITRPELIAAVHAALDEGHYVEIRGDAGVGKSAVLKHFAERLAAESEILVLSPGRTTPRGWAAMRVELRFDGTARDFLSDLASAGGVVLFIDGLDFFSDDEHRTVVDLVREVANIPGFSVIATARREFGTDDPNWLPSGALEKLGRAAPVLIDDLNEAEVNELRSEAPGLAGLLADGHPARAVTRNLFRLSRLASRPAGEAVPRTEIDMPEQWWSTADGKHDDAHRERARLLRALAEQALMRAEPMDASNHPAPAVDDLVKSETLRDLRDDNVSFRHDVLREWAIANLLFSKPAMIDRLALDRPASAGLARGVELTARMVLERASDGVRWKELLRVLSRDGAHGSWRRAALLALVRSEIGSELLPKVSDLLLADRASLLRELIRTVMAVDSVPASEILSAVGLDPSAIPANLYVPGGPSWHRLIRWLIDLGEHLPAASIPDVVDLYSKWSFGTLGRDSLTPALLASLHRSLVEIETARDVDNFQDLREPFGGELDHDRIRSLESDLRTGFLSFCNRTPSLAAEYLRSLEQRRHHGDVVRNILKFRGSLAQAAPGELAKLTEDALISKRRPSDEPDHRSELRGPFDFIDLDFIPASPAQGPFLDLLTYAPERGLWLVRRLVDYAISFYSNDKQHGSDAIVLPFSDGDRPFGWARSYSWSRETSGAPYCVTSALMALEAWAHGRIEAGEPFDQVLSEVLGPPCAPAAYLLVAVDLMLSHWPKSREASVPFLGCPELLCLDRQRLVGDSFEYPDIFRLKALQMEPVGPVTHDSLKKRPSRRLVLEHLLCQYAVSGPDELRERIADSLRRSLERLGPPDEQSDLGDPAFMVIHALNLVDPSNWKQVSDEDAEGRPRTVCQYVPPEMESRHLEALREAAQDRSADSQMQVALGLAPDAPSPSSAEFITAGIAWARRAMASPKEDGTDASMREHASVGAAMIAMRDGNAELRAEQESWAREVFSRALQTKHDSVHRFRPGLKFNPIAIAFVGFCYLLRDHADATDVRTLLEVAASDNPAAAHGFGTAADTLATIDERLPRAVLRCAFAARVQPWHDWTVSDEQIAEISEHHRRRIQNAVEAELAWLNNERAEPPWPEFPVEPAVARRGIRLSGRGRQKQPSEPEKSRVDTRVDHQGAGLWLGNAATLLNVGARPWLVDIVRTYSPWTAAANGAGLDKFEEVASTPDEWNRSYFDLLADCLPGLASHDVDQLALTPISALPDESFFDVVTLFLRSLDAVYFNDRGLQMQEAVRIRATLADRMVATRGWRWLEDSRWESIEVHIGPAIAAFFMNDYGTLQPPKCYLLPGGVDRLDPFLPLLTMLVEKGSCLFVALVTLDLFEVSPKPIHLPFIISAAKAWQARFPDDSRFWIDNAIGRRICALIQEARRQEPSLLDPDQTLRADVDRILAALVRVGVAEARQLEKALADVT